MVIGLQQGVDGVAAETARQKQQPGAAGAVALAQLLDEDERDDAVSQHVRQVAVQGQGRQTAPQFTIAELARVQGALFVPVGRPEQRQRLMCLGQIVEACDEKDHRQGDQRRTFAGRRSRGRRRPVAVFAFVDADLLYGPLEVVAAHQQARTEPAAFDAVFDLQRIEQQLPAFDLGRARVTARLLARRRCGQGRPLVAGL